VLAALVVPALVAVAVLLQSGRTGASVRPNAHLDHQWMQMSRALRVTQDAMREAEAVEDWQRANLTRASITAFCRALAGTGPPFTDEGKADQARAWSICLDNGYAFPLATPSP
jgi:hypothetical protein